MQFKDHFSKQSDTYAKFRPSYPDELFTFLASLCPAHDLAWDCATGNGQAANSLTKYFNKVVATDASEAQLKNAKQNEKVTYKLALAEDSGIESSSADIVTIAAAIHWFDFEKFYKEVKRVLKPGGIIAAWTYNDASVNSAVDACEKKLSDGILRDYCPKESQLVKDRYRTIPFPFERIETPTFSYSRKTNLHDLEEYFKTWSATQRYIDTTGRNPYDEVRKDFADAWGNSDEMKDIRWDLVMLIGKV